MFNKQFYFFSVFFILTWTNCYSQKTADIQKKDSLVSAMSTYNPLAPAKAAFYSAILPGLGQAYNKKYWKIPLVYGALGSGIYFYNNNNKNYNRLRDAYKLRINGKPDEFNGEGDLPFLSKEALVSAQKSYKKDRDLSMLVTIGLYVLQIIEASANAHLLQHNVDNNLSFRPKLIKNDASNRAIVGASINFNF